MEASGGIPHNFYIFPDFYCDISFRGSGGKYTGKIFDILTRLRYPPRRLFLISLPMTHNKLKMIHTLLTKYHFFIIC